MNTPSKMSLLWLLQLSDSALPIGALSHSFGLETLAMQESLTAARLELFLHDYLEEVVGLEIHFCGAAYQLGRRDMGPEEIQSWLDLNAKLGAFKMARESRTASSTLGRRFIHLVDSLAALSVLQIAIAAARQTAVDVYHCTAFGLASAALGIGEEAALLAYSHQTLANLISVCQRLLPVGQTQASRLLWDLKLVLTEVVSRAQENRFDVDQAYCFVPLLEVVSMRHPSLSTRLFIS